MVLWPLYPRMFIPLLHNLSRNSKISGQLLLIEKTIGKHFLCTVSEGTIIFDREAKRIQRDRAAQLNDFNVCQYVKVTFNIYHYVIA